MIGRQAVWKGMRFPPLPRFLVRRLLERKEGQKEERKEGSDEGRKEGSDDKEGRNR